MSKKQVQIGNKVMSMSSFVNDYAKRFLRPMTKSEVTVLNSIEVNDCYFLNIEPYMCRVERVK